MIHSQCVLEKDCNFAVAKANEWRERMAAEIMVEHEKRIEEAREEYEKATYDILRMGREKKIEGWTAIRISVSKIMFESTLVNRRKRADVLREIHEWLESCKGDVFVFEYVPGREDGDSDKVNYSIAGSAGMLKSSSNHIEPAKEEFPDHNNVVLYFEEASDAMNFKLTWC